MIRWTKEQKNYIYTTVLNANVKQTVCEILAEEFGTSWTSIYQVYVREANRLKEVDEPATADSLVELEGQVYETIDSLFKTMRKLQDKNIILQRKLDEANADLEEMSKVFQIARRLSKEHQPNLNVVVGQNGVVETVRRN